MRRTSEEVYRSIADDANEKVTHRVTALRRLYKIYPANSREAKQVIYKLVQLGSTVSVAPVLTEQHGGST